MSAPLIHPLRWKSISVAVRQAGVDQVVISDKLNFAYATGHLSREFDKRFRVLLLAIDSAGTARALVPESECEVIQRNCPRLDVRPYSDAFAHSSLTEFVRDLAKHTNGHLGIEGGLGDMPCVPPSLYTSLCYGRVKLCNVGGSILRCRMIKDVHEREALLAAGEISQKAWLTALKRFRPGMKLTDIKRILAVELCRRGADYNFPGHVDVANATRRGADIVGEGEVVWCDFGAAVDGYQADISRRAVFGKHRKRTQLAAHERGRRLLNFLVSQLGPGKTCSEAVRRVLEVYQDISDGAPPTGRIGHGLGLSASEPPSLCSTDDTVLRPGMVLTPEPSFLCGTGEFVHVEEMVMITESGTELLSVGADTLYTTG
jgi:Xaa-Pro aminopeptidase